MNKTERNKIHRETYDKINKILLNCGLMRAECIAMLECMKLDIILNEGAVVLDGKVGSVKGK